MSNLFYSICVVIFLFLPSNMANKAPLDYLFMTAAVEVLDSWEKASDLYLFSFFAPKVLDSRGLKILRKKWNMSGKVTMRTQKLGTCLLGRPHWIAGRRGTSIEKQNGEFQHQRLCKSVYAKYTPKSQSSPQSNAFRFAPGTLELRHSRGQEFPSGPLEKSRGSGRASCICLSS